jgi:hypothetical protein
MSLLLLILMIVYGAIKANILFNRLYPNISMQTQIIDLDLEPQLTPSEYGFDIAFGLGDTLDPKYGYYDVRET